MQKNAIMLLIALFLISWVSCKTPQSAIINTPIKSEIKIIERLVPFEVPADSAVIAALLECDSMGQVRLKELDELKSKGFASEFNLKNNRLNYTVTKFADTVYVPAKDSIKISEKPVYIDVPYEVNKITLWQNIRIWTGNIVLILLAGGILYKLRKYLKII